MKINWVLVGSIAVTILVISLGILLAPRGSGNANLNLNEKARLEIDRLSFDWGDINMDDGVVNHKFKVKNVGEENLKLANFKTSCMCTTARLRVKSKGTKVEESPIFGMHTKSNWVGTLEPGGEGEIEVVFDPAYHGPQGTGPIMRTVTFETNDNNNSVVELKLEANVN